MRSDLQKISQLFLFLILFPGLTSGQTSTPTTEERLHKLEDEILDLKINSISQKLNWAGELTNSFDYYNSDAYTSRPEARQIHSLYHRLRLHANAEVNENLAVYATLSAAQYSNQSLLAPQVSIDQPSHNSNGLALRMEKAFFNYSFLDSQLTMSAGRLPTSYGPPQDIHANVPRMGTYPSFAFSVPLDGVALTWTPSKSFQWQDKLHVRFIYTPISSMNNIDPASGVSAGSQSNVRGQLTSNADTYMAMMEYENSRLPLMQNLHFILQAVQLNVGRTQPIQTRGVMDSVLPSDRNSYEIAQPSEKALIANYFTSYLEFSKVMDSNFTFYVMQKYTSMKKRGDLIATILEDNESGALGPAGTQFNLGGLLTGNQDRRAKASLYGLNWKNRKENFALGAEYVSIHEGSMPASLIQLHPTNFYNNIGKGYHLYSSLFLVPNTFYLMFGYMNTDRTHRYNGFNYTPQRQTVENIYLTSVVNF